MTDQLRPRVAAFLAAWVAYDAERDPNASNGPLYLAMCAADSALDASDNDQCFALHHLLAVLEDCFAAMRGGQ